MSLVLKQNEIIDSRKYWITGNSDLISYKQMDENYAVNVRNLHYRNGMKVPKDLKERIEYLKSQRKRRKLF